MTTHTLPDARPAALTLLDLLRTLPFVDIFSNSVVENDVQYDDDGKVHGYAVLWFGGGRSPNARLSATPDSKIWGFQITCVGGDTNRVLWVVDQVTGLICGRRLQWEDGKTTPINQMEMSDRIQRDLETNPPRFYLPLLFHCKLEKETDDG